MLQLFSVKSKQAADGVGGVVGRGEYGAESLGLLGLALGFETLCLECEVAPCLQQVVFVACYSEERAVLGIDVVADGYASTDVFLGSIRGANLIDFAA